MEGYNLLSEKNGVCDARYRWKQLGCIGDVEWKRIMALLECRKLIRLIQITPMSLVCVENCFSRSCNVYAEQMSP